MKGLNKELLAEGRRLWKNSDAQRYRGKGSWDQYLFWLSLNGTMLLDLSERTVEAEDECDKHVQQRNDYMGSMTILKSAALDLINEIGHLELRDQDSFEIEDSVKALEKLL